MSWACPMVLHGAAVRGRVFCSPAVGVCIVLGPLNISLRLGISMRSTPLFFLCLQLLFGAALVVLCDMFVLLRVFLCPAMAQPFWYVSSCCVCSLFRWDAFLCCIICTASYLHAPAHMWDIFNQLVDALCRSVSQGVVRCELPLCVFPPRLICVGRVPADVFVRNFV